MSASPGMEIIVRKVGRIAELFHQEDCETLARQEQLLQLAEMIERIERSTRHLLQHHAHRAGLTVLDSQVLAAIYERNEDARPGVIADDVHMPLSTMTSVAARLERRELVERARASDDGRSYVLRITGAGEDVLLKMLSSIFDDLDDVLDESGGGALDDVVTALGKVCTIAEMLETRARGAGSVN